MTHHTRFSQCFTGTIQALSTGRSDSELWRIHSGTDCIHGIHIGLTILTLRRIMKITLSNPAITGSTKYGPQRCWYCFVRTNEAKASGLISRFSRSLYVFTSYVSNWAKVCASDCKPLNPINIWSVILYIFEKLQSTV